GVMFYGEIMSMSSESKVAIVTIILSSVVSLSTLISNHLLQKDMQTKSHEFELKVVAQKHNHDKEIKNLENQFKFEKERCNEFEILMQDLVSLKLKSKSDEVLTEKDMLAYYKSSRFLKNIDFNDSKSPENADFLEVVDIMLHRMSNEYGTCFNKT
ncbi:hypothetical protein, partial [Vibrio parahaemolyticus]|uniref:hypothetical protein n=3 Tax=Vibrio parahaemolyticus TaxID=670 RepID=UPI001FAC4E42